MNRDKRAKLRRRRTPKPELTPEQKAARLKKNEPPIDVPQRLYDAYRAGYHKRDGVKNMQPWAQLAPHERKLWMAVAVEAQNFARESLVEMVKKLTGKDAVQDATDDVAAGKPPRRKSEPPEVVEERIIKP